MKNTFRVHVPNLIPVEFLLFIKARFTKNDKNIPHLNQDTNRHVSSVISIHFEDPGAAASSLTGIKISLVKRQFIFSCS